MVNLTIDFIDNCKNLIAKAKTDEALHHLRNAVNQSQNEILLLCSKWEYLKSRQIKGVISNEEFDRERQNINDKMLDLLKALESEINPLKQNEEFNSHLKQQKFKDRPTFQKPKPINQKLLYGMGIIVLILLVIASRYFITKDNVERVGGEIKMEFYDQALKLYDEKPEEAITKFEQHLEKFKQIPKEERSKNETYCESLISIMGLKIRLIIDETMTFAESGIQETIKVFKEDFCDKRNEELESVLEILKSKGYIIE